MDRKYSMRKRNFGVKKKKSEIYSIKRLPQIKPVKRCKLRLLKLERLKDWLLLEEELLKMIKSDKEHHSMEESKNRKIIDRLRGKPMTVATLNEFIDEKHAIISVGPAEFEYYVTIKSFVDKEQLEINSKVLVNARNLSIVGILTDDFNPLLASVLVDHAPKETFQDIGGLDEQINEIREAVELPLTHPELYENMGIRPPKGIILYGPPGTGKTLLARAIANSSDSTFFHIVGSELVKKTLGEGPKMVRDLFRLAADHSPTIIFFDEIDSIGIKRNEESGAGEKEIQRTMLELLNQLDGFDKIGDVKVIMATNRIEALDPALIRPGRIDRKIEIPLPDEKAKKRIFAIQSQKMRLNENIKFDDIFNDVDLSGADIKAICIEAGYAALRQKRMMVNESDLKKAKDRVILKQKKDITEAYFQ